MTANVKNMGDSISLGYHHSFTKDIALAVVLDQQVTMILKAINQSTNLSTRSPRSSTPTLNSDQQGRGQGDLAVTSDPKP